MWYNNFESWNRYYVKPELYFEDFQHTQKIKNKAYLYRCFYPLYVY